MAGAAIGGIIGAAGQIGAAELSKPSNSSANTIFPQFDPFLNSALAGSVTDALSLIGRGNIGSEPTPIEQLIGRINSLGINEKLKRRALDAIGRIRDAGAFGIEDAAFARNPREEQHSFGDIQRINSLTRQGLTLQDAEERVLGTKKTSRVPFSTELRGVLNRLGLTESDFSDLLQEDSDFRQRQETLRGELSGFNETTIRNRARAAAEASQLLGDAAGFASTGQPQSQLQTDLLNRINRGINDQEERFLLQSNFGGFQPGGGLENFARAREDAPLTALEQSLAAAAGLTSGLGGGLEFAQQSAAQSGNLAQGAANIAAQQANAANQIRARNDLAGAENFASGIAAGASSLGSAISNYSLQRQLDQLNKPGFNSTGTNYSYNPAVDFNLDPYATPNF